MFNDFWRRLGKTLGRRFAAFFIALASIWIVNQLPIESGKLKIFVGLLVLLALFGGAYALWAYLWKDEEWYRK